MHEYTAWQQTTVQWAPFWRWLFQVPEWIPAACDVKHRPVDTTTVGVSRPVEWPAGWADTVIHSNPTADLTWDKMSLRGYPMQRARPDRSERFQLNNTYTGELRDVYLPGPSGSLGWWTESMPARDAIGSDNVWDRHWIGVQDDGTVFEAIQLRRSPVRGVLGYSVWNADGRLIEGRPVTAAGIALHRLVYDRFDTPHRLGLAIANYSGGDGDKDWPFPRCGDWVRLSAAALDRVHASKPTAEVLSFAEMLHTHGAVIFDRGGDGNKPGGSFAFTAGAQWAQRPLQALSLTFNDLEVVIG
jgi:hypothetical protein